MPKRKVTLSLDNKIYSDFQDYCEENAIMLSKKIELFMKSALKSKNKKSFLIINLFLSIFLSIYLASASQIFYDDFESGNLNSWSLSGISGANNWTASTTNPYSGIYHAESIPSSTTKPASIMQKTISTSGYENIQITYQRKLIGLDLRDEFQAEWFDGNNWNILEATGSDSVNDANYFSKQFTLPDSAKDNLNFAIKFECTAGAVSEICEVDNLQINGTLIDTEKPLIILYSPENKTYNTSSIFLNYYVWDNNNVDQCWYSIDSSPNISLPNCATATLSGLQEGSHTTTIYANDSYNNLNFSTSVFSIDTKSPQWSQIQTSIPKYYSPDFISSFNITWSDEMLGIDSVWFESNFSGNKANYTTEEVSSNVYQFEANLPAGVFYWKSYANDTINNINETSEQIITISKAQNEVTLKINNETNSNKTITYGELSNTEAIAQKGQVELYKDSILIQNPEITILSANQEGYKYTALALGNQNYSQNSTEYYLIINKKQGNITLLLDNLAQNKTVSYKTKTNATTYSENLSPSLYRNGLQVNTEDSRILSAGIYNYTAIIEENENITYDTETLFLNVTKISPNLNLNIDGLPLNKIITYGEYTEITAAETNTGDSDLVYSLYKNNNLIQTGSSLSDNGIFAAKNYIYIYSSNEGENYTSSNTTINLTINKKTPEIILTINGFAENISQTYGNLTEVIAEIEDSNLNIKLILNNQLLIENQSIISSNLDLSAGEYNITSTFDYENENYTSSSITRFLKINKASPQLELKLNNQDLDISISTNAPLEINSTLKNSQDNEIILYENNIERARGNNISIQTSYSNIGENTWKASIAETENYTSVEISRTAVVLDPSSPQFSNLKKSPDSPVSYLNQRIYGFNSTWTDNIAIDEIIFEFDGTNYSLKADQINKNNDEYYKQFSDLAAGIYYYKWYANDTSGNKVSTPLQTYTIEKSPVALFLTFSPENNVIYGTNITISCSANNPESIPILSRNVSILNNPETEELTVGTYSYACIVLTTQNYTGGSITSNAQVTKANPTIRLFLNGNENNLTITTETEINITAFLENPLYQPINLTINNLEINYSSGIIENISKISSESTIRAIFLGNENYTSKMKELEIKINGGTNGNTGDSAGGGGGGGGGSISTKNASIKSKQENQEIEISGLGDLILHRGEEKVLEITVKNNGQRFLNKCKISMGETYSDWLLSNTLAQIGPGELTNFIFKIKVPNKELSPPKEIYLSCLEKQFTIPINLFIVNVVIYSSIESINLDSNNKLHINYSLKSNTATKEKIEVLVFNENNKVIAGESEEVNFEKEKTINREKILDISNTESNMLKIVIKKENSEFSLIEEYFAYNKQDLAGFAVLNNFMKENGSITITSIIFSALALLVIIRIIKLSKIRKILNLKKKVKVKKGKNVKL